MNRRALFALAPIAGVALAAAALPALASEGEGGGAPKDAFIRFPALTATIIRPDGRRGVMTVEVGINVEDAEVRTQAALDMPRLRAAYNIVAQQAAAALRPGEPPDLERMSHDLAAATYRVLRKRGAVVLLGTVMVN
ncbi:hypothetical protein BH10PSE2_BH10PSE2_06880 [soil metagenome]